MKLKTLYILQFIVTGVSAGVNALIPFIAISLSLTLSQSGLMGSIIMGGRIVMAIPTIFISRKLPNKYLIFCSALIMAIGLALLGLSSTYVFILVVVAGVSIGAGLFQPLAKTEIAKVALKGKKGKIISNYSIAAQIGKLVFSSAIGFVVIYAGWRNSAVIVGTVLSLLICVLIFREWKKRSEIVAESKTNAIKFKANAGIVFSILASMLDSIASSAVIIYLPFLLLSKNLNIIYVPIANGVIIVGAILGKFVLGRLTDKKPESLVFVVSEIFMAVLTIVICFNLDIYLVLLVVLLLGFVSKGTSPLTQIMVGNSVKHDDHLKTAFSLDSFFANVGDLLGVLLFGLIGDMYGVQAIFIGFSIAALVAALPGVMYLVNSRKEVSLTLSRS